MSAATGHPGAPARRSKPQDPRHATLDGSYFKFCNFSRADLRGASLRFATFAACALQEADLRDCDLTGTTFGPVNTGTDDNAYTDVTGAAWSPDGARSAAFEHVVGAPD